MPSLAITRLGWKSLLGVALASAIVIGGCRREAPRPQGEQPTNVAPPAPSQSPAELLRLPRKTGSIRFAAIGDAGRGDPAQYAVSAQMQAYRKVFPYDFVVMLGDNVYDGGTPEDYRQKFELPYKPLLDAGVKFYATIGNHDDRNQPSYAPFHMDGHRYYTFQPTSILSRILGDGVRFFMIDTESLDRAQLQWVDGAMEQSHSEWKIPIFHRPDLPRQGGMSTPARALRRALEPLFIRHGVSVVFSGHEHFYERI